MNRLSLSPRPPHLKSAPISSGLARLLILAACLSPLSVSAANAAPTISVQTFTIPENPTPGAVIGTVLATDPDVGDALTYTIVDHTADSGDPRQNPSGIFVLSATGLLTVKSTLTQ